MPESKQKLTAEHFYKFFQCPHWIWYDLYEDQQKKKAVPPLMQMIYEDGLRHEKEIIAGRKFEEIDAALFKDLDEAFLATVELMKKGKNIYHGVLMDEHWVGIPDLLESRPLQQGSGQAGKSKLGDHYYVVYDIKNSKEIKDEHKFQLVFYSLILERLQGVRPEEAYIINSEGREKSFLIDEFLDYFHLTRENIEKILEGQKPPPFLKSGCKKTPWYSLCLSDTEGCRDVSLIFRLSQMDQRRLYEIGIKTIDQLASSSVDELQVRLESWPYDKIVRFHNQAQSLIKNEMVILKKSKFPEVKTEVYFDIESDPTRGIFYLLGILIKDTTKKSPASAKASEGAAEYKYFLAKDKSDEKRMWEEFCQFVESLEDFVIYHYAWYEKQTFDRLALQYGVKPAVAEKFKNNTIDLNRAVVDAVVLPLYFYTLKDVARFVGFQWQAADAGGAESVVWYNQWMEKGDKKILQKILDYNKDDVVATLVVKEWLEKQKPKMQREILPEL